MNNFSQNLIFLRRDRNLTQPQLAKAINVSNAVVSFWENGKNEPKVSYIKKLANFFGVTTDFLLGQTDEWGNNLDTTGNNSLLVPGIRIQSFSQ